MLYENHVSQKTKPYFISHALRWGAVRGGDLIVYGWLTITTTGWIYLNARQVRICVCVCLAKHTLYGKICVFSWRIQNIIITAITKLIDCFWAGSHKSINQNQLLCFSWFLPAGEWRANADAWAQHLAYIYIVYDDDVSSICFCVI